MRLALIAAGLLGAVSLRADRDCWALVTRVAPPSARILLPESSSFALAHPAATRKLLKILQKIEDRSVDPRAALLAVEPQIAALLPEFAAFPALERSLRKNQEALAKALKKNPVLDRSHLAPLKSAFFELYSALYFAHVHEVSVGLRELMDSLETQSSLASDFAEIDVVTRDPDTGILRMMELKNNPAIGQWTNFAGKRKLLGKAAKQANRMNAWVPTLQSESDYQMSPEVWAVFRHRLTEEEIADLHQAGVRHVRWLEDSPHGPN
jgi:hypothetical protein